MMVRLGISQQFIPVPWPIQAKVDDLTLELFDHEFGDVFLERPVALVQRDPVVHRHA